MGLFRKEFGKKGEEEAARFLKKSGYRILDKNYRCRYGEIDIVAKDGETIAFVEVKTRNDDSFGSPSASVDHRKQRHMTLASSCYLSANRLDNAPSRFDVVSIIWRGKEPSIELIKDAFEAREM